MKVFVLSLTKSLTILSCLMLLLFLGSNNFSSVKSTLDVFLTSVFPSLFPFVIFTEYMIQSNILEIITNRKNGKNSNYLTVILLGFLCGFPSAAKAISSLYEQGKLTKKQCVFLLSFTSNCSPVYILTTIGVTMFHSSTIGILLLLSHYLSAIIIGVISYLFYSPSIIQENTKKLNSITVKSEITRTNFEIIKKGIVNSFLTFGNMLGFMIVFNLIGDTIVYLLKCNIIPINNMITGIFELSKGIVLLSKLENTQLSLILISFIMSFSGLSVIFQIKACFGKLRVSLTKLLFFKLVHGIISCLITYLLLKCIPEQTLSVFVNVENVYDANFLKQMYQLYIYFVSATIFILSSYFTFCYLKVEKKKISELYKK